MASLRDLLPGFNWAAVNSTAGGGSKEARQSLLEALSKAGYDPNGSMGAYQLMSGNSGGGDNGGGTGDYYQGPDGTQISAADIKGFQDQQSRWGSQGLLSQDRGDYNRFATDLGQLQYDPVKGIYGDQSLNFQTGSKYNTNFNHDFNGILAAGTAAVGAGLYGMNAGIETPGTFDGANPLLGDGSTGNIVGAESPGSLLNPTDGVGVGGTSANAAGTTNPGLLQNMGNWAMAHPLDAARAGMGAYSLGSALFGNKTPTTSNSSSAGTKGGTAGAPVQFNTAPPQYTPNPYTIADLMQSQQRGY